jgi:hypothetical protein
MSDLSSSHSPSSNDADADADEDALVFARCSPGPAGDSVSPSSKDGAGKKKAAAVHDDHALPNLRRTHLAFRHWVISLSTSLIIGLLVLFVGRWFYLNKIEPRLAASATPAAPAAASAAAAAPLASATTDSALRTELAQSAELITALQKQVDVMRREQLLMQQNTRESLEKISATLKNSEVLPEPASATAGATPPGATTPGATTNDPGVSRIAGLKPLVTPTQQEFIQLKERNRLTQYADEAIATGMRQPLELLVEYMRNPQAEHLHDAAQAEFMRAVRAIQMLQRDDPGYHLPVAELFKDGSIRAEADVKPEALLKLLADYKQPVEVRARVCFLLLGSTLPQTNAQLIKSIKEDPSLDVAKHAQLALEQRVKMRFRFFDIAAIEEWFKTQGK